MQLNPSNYVNVYIFNAADIKVITPPNGAFAVGFSSTGNFFVNFNGFVASGSGKTDGSGDELNPTTRYLGAEVPNFSIYAPAAITVSVAFYGIQ